MLNSRKILLVSTILLAGLYFMPLWHIRLEAPQFPEGLSMYIWINKISGSTPNTLNTINILNHYIGMKHITQETFPELRYFPYIVGGLIILGLIVFLINKKVIRISWVVILIVLAVLGILDFHLWEYNYGHNLNPEAPIKIPGMTYQPPLLGAKSLLNFNAISLPYAGGWLLAISILLGILAITMDIRKRKHLVAKSLSIAVLLIGTSLLSCGENSPEPIAYGTENCDFCSMRIMDNRFGAELITDKGRIKKFDSAECLLRELTSEQNAATKYYRIICVTNFKEPGHFIDARTAYYLKGSRINSPMGANLSAYTGKQPAMTDSTEYGGDIVSWTELKDSFFKKP